MPTQKLVTNASVKNRGGTIVNGGTSSDTVITKIINVNELSTGNAYGSKVLENDGSGGEFTDPWGIRRVRADNSGPLAYNPNRYSGERNFIMLGAGDEASKINNSGVSLLNVPGAQLAGVGQRTVHKLLSTRRLGVTTYNVLATPSSGVVSGRTKGNGNGNVVRYVATSGNGTVNGTDDAASSTRSIPGELTYAFGSIPVSVDYKAVDSAEV